MTNYDACITSSVVIHTITVECHLSEHVGTEGCSDNRNVRIIDGLTYDIVNSQYRTHASHLLHI